ncbi:MAG: branched-chain amino acid ABC transporter permease [Oscillospiraceae bacterium]
MRKTTTIPMPLRYIINFVLFALFLFSMNSLITGGTISNYYSGIISLIGINIILAVSLNVATGYLGQLPLGHAGFMAVGAYTSAIVMKTFAASSFVAANPGLLNVVFPIGLVAGGLVAALFGLLIGIPALRLRGDYLAILTLGFGEIIRVVLLNIDSVLGFTLTNGAAGLQKIPMTTNFLVTFIFVGFACFVIHTMMKSRHGRAILSIRENEIAAEACGINTTYYKTLGFVVSAFFAGIAGGLFAGNVGILNPSSFGFMKSIEILVMVVLGGMGSMFGSILSATVLTALPEMLRSIADWRMVAYSLVLVVVMIFKPSGLMGTYDFSLSRWLEKIISFFRGKEKVPVAATEKEGKSDE